MTTQEFDWNDSYAGNADDYSEPDGAMLETIATLPPGRALDIGCGAGGLVAALAERGWQVTGIDLAEKAITAAAEVMRTRGLRAELIRADATSWRPAARYDLITSCFALPETADKRAAVYAMIRASLAPGGVVLVKDFDSSMARHQFFASFDLVTTEELRREFDGLQIARAEVVETPVHDHDGSGSNAGQKWTAALLHARRPTSE